MQDAVQDWLRVHRDLVGAEIQFSTHALDAVAGTISTKELAQRRAFLETMRQLCGAAYARAFPDSLVRR